MLAVINDHGTLGGVWLGCANNFGFGALLVLIDLSDLRVKRWHFWTAERCNSYQKGRGYFFCLVISENESNSPASGSPGEGGAKCSTTTFLLSHCLIHQKDYNEVIKSQTWLYTQAVKGPQKMSFNTTPHGRRPSVYHWVGQQDISPVLAWLSVPCAFSL